MILFQIILLVMCVINRNMSKSLFIGSAFFIDVGCVAGVNGSKNFLIKLENKKNVLPLQPVN